MAHPCICEIRKRADHHHTDTAPGRAYPIDDHSLGLANANGLRTCGPRSATFVVTKRTIDRDGDLVEPRGLSFANWKAAGAPWFLFHQEHPWPIGSSINPDGNLDVW